MGRVGRCPAYRPGKVGRGTFPMNLTQAIRHCFKNSLNFSSRADHYEFWNFVIFLVAASILLTIVNSLVFGPTVTESVQIQIDLSGNQSVGLVRKANYDSGWLGTIFGIITLIPFIAITIRRLHDRDKSGWYILTPAFGFALAFGMLFLNTVKVPIDTTGLPAEFPTEISMPAGPFLFLVSWLIAAASIVVLIVRLARQGTQGPNRFGPNPNEVPS